MQQHRNQHRRVMRRTAMPISAIRSREPRQVHLIDHVDHVDHKPHQRSVGSQSRTSGGNKKT
jgi:hypothetical protein